VSSNFRGVYLVGNEQTAQEVVVQVLDYRDWSLSPWPLAVYASRGIEPGWKDLWWEADILPKAATPKPRSNLN